MQEMTLLKKVCLFVTCFCLLLISTESYSFTTKRSLLPSILYRTSLAAGKPVEITFEPSGKVVMAEQGDVIAEVAAKAGVYIPYKCKQGRCNSCELRLNGRGKLSHLIINCTG